MTKFLPTLALLLAAATSFAQTAAPAVSAATPSPGFSAPADDALFRDLGGNAGIDAIVGDFVPRLVADPRTGEFFRKANQAHLEEMQPVRSLEMTEDESRAVRSYAFVSQKPMIMVASGTGFAPIKSIVEHSLRGGVVDTGAEQQRRLAGALGPGRFRTSMAQGIA